jgi:PAS domain S-box-containing protein
MKRFPPRSTLLIVVAIGILIGSLAFAAVRLLQVERNLRKEEAYTQLWMVSQSQYETVLLADALDQAWRGERAEHVPYSPLTRLDRVLSYLSMLIEDAEGGLVDGIGELPELKRIYIMLSMARPTIAAGLTQDQALRLRDQSREAGALLQTISAKVMRLTQDRDATERRDYLRLVFEILASMIGVFFASTILFYGFFRGIRETSRARRLLRQEQELSDLVINNISNQGIVIFDGKLNGLLWNPGMEALLGATAGQTVGHNLRQEVAFFRKELVSKALLQAIEGRSSIIEDEGFQPSGPERCLEIHSFPLVIGERKLGIAFFRDVTEQWVARRQAERQNFDLEIQVQQRTAALRQAERRLIAAIETAPEGFAAFDNAGRLLFANERIRAAEPLSSWSGGSMTLESFLQCFARCEGADSRLMQAGEGFHEISVDLRIAKDMWAQLSVTRADAGTVFVRLTDISGYKRAAQALQSALERERETTSAYRNFVSMVSHQFRTPLAILDSSAQRLIRRGEGVPHEEMLMRVQRMRSATNRLTRLVESVLNAAKLDAGRIEVNLDHCNLVELVNEICERQRDQTPQAKITLQTPDEPIDTYCDSILVEQVVINLLSNAVKYSRDNPVVEIAIWIEGGRAYCSVRDSGLGIPEDELSRIFDRFYRARTASGIAGTGIGLNFAQKIVQLHGGSIRVQSHEAIGSVFTFDLPLIAAGQANRAA